MKADVDMTISQAQGLTRRKALAGGAVAGVGLLSIPLPAAAIATSGGAGGAGGGGPELTGWSLTTLSVYDLGDGMTNLSVQVNWDGSGTAGPHDWFVRFYRIISGERVAIDGAATSGAAFSSSGSQPAFLGEFLHNYVAGGYAARLFVNKNFDTAADSEYLVELTGNFI